jgi:hypothetical protein
VRYQRKCRVLVGVRRVGRRGLARHGNGWRFEHLLLENGHQLTHDFCALGRRHRGQRIDQAGSVVRALDADAASTARLHLDERDRRIDTKLERILLV